MMWEQKRHDDVRCAVSNPATAKATQKELTLEQRSDFGHVPLAEIRIELAGIIKRCTGSHAAIPCHDVGSAMSVIRQQRRQLKKNLLLSNVVTCDTSQFVIFPYVASACASLETHRSAAALMLLVVMGVSARAEDNRTRAQIVNMFVGIFVDVYLLLFCLLNFFR